MYITDEELNDMRRQRIVDFAVEGFHMQRELDRLKSHKNVDPLRIESLEFSIENCDVALKAACQVIHL